MTEKEKEQQNSLLQNLIATLAIATAILVVICIVLSCLVDTSKKKEKEKENVTVKTDKPEIEEMLLTPNKYSRPQIPLKEVNAIVIHYTANAGSSAEGNRNYFENLKNKKKNFASSHFIVGLKGEIIQCVPLDEISYASNNRNSDTIAIECCHEDDSGKFNEKTYQSVVELVAWLCGKYNLQKDDIIRHYDVTGKQCPKYYVKHKKAWSKLKDDVFDYIKKSEENEKKEEK